MRPDRNAETTRVPGSIELAERIVADIEAHRGKGPAKHH
jgi:hypothetical protein